MPDKEETEKSDKIERPAADTLAEQSVDSPEIDHAVDDIEKHEGDELLEAQDAEIDRAVHAPENLKQKLRRWLQSWWDNKRVRYATLAGLAVLLMIMFTVQPVRAFVLNTVGIRGGASLTVLDKTTELPLKDAKVMIGNRVASSDKNGVVHLAQLHLGKQTLTVQKVAFATLKRSVTIGLGTTKFDSVSLTAVGNQYRFTVTDYLSDKPVKGVEASNGSASAISDSQGKITLTLNNPSAQTFGVTFKAAGYNDTQAAVTVGSSATLGVQLVPTGKDIFVSNASGHYDVYSSDLNGQNRKLVLAGTGNENSNITLSVSPDGKEAALIDTRDSMHDADGFLLNALTLINLSTDTPLTIEHAEQIQALGWLGNDFVYEETVAGASAANPGRSHLNSYNYSTNARYQLAAANQFNAALTADGAIYYATSSTDPSIHPAFYKVDAEDTNRQTIMNQEVWTFFRLSYSTLDLQTPAGWFVYTLGAKSTASTSPLAVPTDFTFTDNADGTESLWTDFRDGKGVLLDHNVSTGKDTTVATQDGLTTPVRWLSDTTVTYRVSSSTETADYAASLSSGTPKKIADVVNTVGISDQ